MHSEGIYTCFAFFRKTGNGKAGELTQIDGFCGLLAVMVLLFAQSYRDHAAVSHFAHRVFELDCRVANTEVSMQALFYVAKNALAD